MTFLFTIPWWSARISIKSKAVDSTNRRRHIYSWNFGCSGKFWHMKNSYWLLFSMRPNDTTTKYSSLARTNLTAQSSNKYVLISIRSNHHYAFSLYRIHLWFSRCLRNCDKYLISQSNLTYIIELDWMYSVRRIDWTRPIVSNLNYNL